MALSHKITFPQNSCQSLRSSIFSGQISMNCIILMNIIKENKVYISFFPSCLFSLNTLQTYNFLIFNNLFAILYLINNRIIVLLRYRTYLLTFFPMKDYLLNRFERNIMWPNVLLVVCWNSGDGNKLWTLLWSMICCQSHPD